MRTYVVTKTNGTESIATTFRFLSSAHYAALLFMSSGRKRGSYSTTYSAEGIRYSSRETARSVTIAWQ